jgi:hypothetical protein
VPDLGLGLGSDSLDKSLNFDGEPSDEFTDEEVETLNPASRSIFHAKSFSKDPKSDRDVIFNDKVLRYLIFLSLKILIPFLTLNYRHLD